MTRSAVPRRVFKISYRRYRSSWGRAVNQEVVLTFRFRRQFFDELLRPAVPSTFDARVYEQWAGDLSGGRGEILRPAAGGIWSPSDITRTGRPMNDSSSQEGKEPVRVKQVLVIRRDLKMRRGK